MSNIAKAAEIKAEKLRYIQAMLGELRTMVEAERYEMLTYMIEMAYIEASDIVRGQPASAMAATDERDAAA